jgi:hypothetical protein
MSLEAFATASAAVETAACIDLEQNELQRVLWLVTLRRQLVSVGAAVVNR